MIKSYLLGPKIKKQMKVKKKNIFFQTLQPMFFFHFYGFRALTNKLEVNFQNFEFFVNKLIIDIFS